MHCLIRSVAVVDAQHLAGLPSVFGTTAFDGWRRDPTRDPAQCFMERTLAAARPNLDGFIADNLEYLRSIGKARDGGRWRPPGRTHAGGARLQPGEVLARS